MEISEHGVKCERTKKGAILYLLSKGIEIRFTTSLSGMKDFVDGRRTRIYFNKIIEEEGK